MNVPCLLIHPTTDLLGGIVMNLIAQQHGFKCREAIADSMTDLLRVVEQYETQVVVLCQPDPVLCEEWALHLLSLFAGLQVITVSGVDNYLHVYGKEEILITKSSDLVSVIEGSL